MSVRVATEADEAVLHELWHEFEVEVPEPDADDRETWDEEWQDTLDDVRAGGVFLAEDESGPIGVARIEVPVRGKAHVQLVYVRPAARRKGTATALLRACAEHARALGATRVSLAVTAANAPAREVWRRFGFEEQELRLFTRLDVLDRRLAAPPAGDSLGSTHVQTDDELSVERAIAHFVPRLEAPVVTSNGSWIRVADAVLDRDRAAHGRFAAELSERLGAVSVALALEQGAVVRFRLYERGRMVDEYLSVPTFYGALPLGDELALAANPTLVARLTGADPDEVRRIARTAHSAAELPPGPELYVQVATLMGLEP